MDDMDSDEYSTSLLSRMENEHSTYPSSNMEGGTSIIEHLQPHQRLLQRLTKIIERAEASYDSKLHVSVAGPSSGSVESRTPPPIPLAVMSYSEWFDVIQYCVRMQRCYGVSSTYTCEQVHADDMESVHYSFNMMMVRYSFILTQLLLTSSIENWIKASDEFLRFRIGLFGGACTRF